MKEMTGTFCYDQKKSDAKPMEADAVNDANEPPKSASPTEEELCPLFMDGLPKDFSTNPALAALASLMDDSNRTSSGCIRRSRRKRRQARRPRAPYQRKQSEGEEEASTLGEAQIFLKLWKI